MCFLCSFSLGGKLTDFDVSFSHQGQDSLLAGIQSQIRKVHRIRTHIGNLSVFIQTLCHHHGLRYCKSQLTGSFLLQRRSSKRCRRRFLHRAGYYIFNRELRILTSFKESLCFLLGLETVGQFCFHFNFISINIRNFKHCCNAIRRFTDKSMYLTFTFHNQTNGNRLHTSGRKSRLYLLPQYR